MAPDVEQSSVGVNLDDNLVHRGGALVAQVAGHLAALKNLTGVLAHTDRARSSVGPTHTVRCVLHTEVPPLDSPLEPFTFANRDRVHKLADLKVTRAEAVPNRQ